MPGPHPKELRLDLAAILAPRSDDDNRDALLRAAGAQANVLIVKARAQQEGIAREWVCAQGLSRRWGEGG